MKQKGHNETIENSRVHKEERGLENLTLARYFEGERDKEKQ